MLIIPHNDHIIRYDSLLFTVIIIIKISWYIVINRQNLSILSACCRKLPDKFHEVLSAVHAELFKIHIDPINSISNKIIHQTVDQLLSCCGG